MATNGTEKNYILLVEDNPSHVLLIQRAFHDAGVNVPLQVVEDGDEALAYLAGYDLYANRELYPLPTLMLLDLKLRRRSGFELLGWLRHHPGLKRLPVVVLTSSEEIEDIDRAYELGANSYLVKPLWSEDGLQKMIKLLEQYWGAVNRKPSVRD
jgi:CheY-like chemotaxis protein